MRRPILAAALGGFALCLQGCLAKATLDVATAPVKVAGKAVDVATTSQSEADEKRGRELRRQEGRLGKLERAYADYDRRCRSGESAACDRRDTLGIEIAAMREGNPG